MKPIRKKKIDINVKILEDFAKQMNNVIGYAEMRFTEYQEKIDKLEAEIKKHREAFQVVADIQTNSVHTSDILAKLK